jgi:hypothetical protein
MTMQMSGEPTLQIPQNRGHTILLLELAVPFCSFGGVLLAMFFSGMANTIDVRYFGVGCVFSSIALAYLAWIRPRKDIVALTTPIYSVIFFIVPSDLSVTIFLELLYAVSLTILLVRMKLRFGTVPESGVVGGNVLEEPLKSYCETVREPATGLNPEVAHYAAVVFARFAEGEYRDAALVAGAANAEPESANAWSVLGTAFDIIREQALMLEESADQPEQFMEFSVSDVGILAKPLPPEDKISARFEVSLENALLLMYAASWNESVKDRPLLLIGQSFALKLINP